MSSIVQLPCNNDELLFENGRRDSVSNLTFCLNIIFCLPAAISTYCRVCLPSVDQWSANLISIEHGTGYGLCGITQVAFYEDGTLPMSLRTHALGILTYSEGSVDSVTL